MGRKIIFPILLRLLGRILSGEEDGNLGKKIKIKKNAGGEEYKVVRNFIHPWFFLYYHWRRKDYGCCIYLEESMMVDVLADIIEVVVLPPSTDTLLGVHNSNTQ